MRAREKGGRRGKIEIVDVQFEGGKNPLRKIQKVEKDCMSIFNYLNPP